MLIFKFQNIMWPFSINIFRAFMLFGVVPLFYKSTRGGGDVLGYEGHEYLVSYNLKDGRSWRCRKYNCKKYKCPATAKTKGTTVDLSKSKPHNHEGNPVQVKYTGWGSHLFQRFCLLFS